MPTLPNTLTFQIFNRFPAGTGQVYASISGYDATNNGKLYMLTEDGTSRYYPDSPPPPPPPPEPYTPVKVTAPVNIPLAEPGKSINVTVPKTNVGRINFSVKNKLTFYLNNGPALVEPSVTNESADPTNYTTQWGFCEFSYNDIELFGNISYVDFIGVPVALEMKDPSGKIQSAKGLASNGINVIANLMKQQTAADGQPWKSLVIQDGQNNNLRILSPNQGILLKATENLFATYYDAYVSQAWQKYTPANPLAINTQNGNWGTVYGAVDNSGNMIFNSPYLPGGTWSFRKPVAKEIFNCSIAPFSDVNDLRGNISARLGAALNRTTLLLSGVQPPVNSDQGTYYKNNPTNHYSRILHNVNVDGLGYAFPYDDVEPDKGGKPLSGKVSGIPASFTVTVGGTQNGVQTVRKLEL